MPFSLTLSFFITIVFVPVQFDRCQAPINGQHIDQCTVEKTVSPYIDQNGLDTMDIKSVFTNPWLVWQRSRCSIKGLGKDQQKEWTRSLFAVAFVRSQLHRGRTWLREKLACIHVIHKSSDKTLQKSECVLRRPSGANWLITLFIYTC